MTAIPLLQQQPVTQSGQMPSRELVEVIQRLVAEIEVLKARVAALEP